MSRQQLYDQAYYQANKERKLAAAKLRYEIKREEIKASVKVYRETHKEQIKAARKEELKVYRETHKEQIKIYHKSYNQIHKEKIKAKKKIYIELNKEEVKAAQRAWRKANPEKNREKSRRRRAKKALVVNAPIRDGFEDFLKEVWDNKCAYCRSAVEKYHLDHFMPITLKGHHAEYNLVLACPTCNTSKNNKHPFLFIKEQKICFTFKPYMRFI